MQWERIEKEFGLLDKLLPQDKKTAAASSVTGPTGSATRTIVRRE